MKYYYTIYDNRNDEIIAFGDSQECAKKLKLTLDSFYSFVSNTRSGKAPRYTVVVDDYKNDDSDE